MPAHEHTLAGTLLHLLSGFLVIQQDMHDRLKEIQKTMATQDDVTALTNQVTAFGDSLTTAATGIQSDLDTLKAANPALDLTALSASVANLSTVTDAITAIDAQFPGTPTV